MTCFAPVLMFKRPWPHKGMTTSSAKGDGTGTKYPIPCGGCIGCRTAHAKQWALRCMHEQSTHDQGSFVTLTYDDEHLPDDYSVHVRPLQLFLKRLRDKVGRFRFFACGEYGEQTLRPHYHLLLFGYWPKDSQLHGEINGHPNYTSETLASAWGQGLTGHGHITYESAGYCARYALKKITGRMAEAHYLRTHPLTGECVRVRPEFITMSRRPGVGAAWFDQYAADCFPSDFLVHNGAKVSIPPYYLRKLAESDQEAVKESRRRKLLQPKARANSTPDRLAVRQEVLERKLEQLKRNYE